MPLLKYRCKDCDNVFDELVLSEGDAVVCGECSSSNVSRHYQGKCYANHSGKASKCRGSCTNCSGCS